MPTAADPLRLLVTGDSLPGYLGPQLVNALSAVGLVRGFVDVHDGTGLTRPDFVDWSVVARQQVVADNPDAVVVWMGGNDFQNMTLPNGAFFQAGTPAWTREYQRRAEICMRIWTQNDSHRVYWLSMPPARDPTWAYDDNQINIALQRAAAAVPGAEYLDILGPITDHGRYTDYVTVNGQPVLVRESDGVHVDIAGSQIVAQEVLPVLERAWRIGYKPPAAPTATPRPSPTHGAAVAQPSATPGRPPAPTLTPRVTQPARAKPSAAAAGPTAFITAGNSPTHPATIFRAGLPRLYGWVRDSALPADARSVGFVWVRLPDRVIDRYTLARSRQAYTGGYETAAATAPGAYRCEIVVGGRLVASAAYTVA